MAAKFRVRDNGALRTITRMTVMQAGVERRIKTMKVMDGGALRLVGKFADPLTVSAFDVGGSGTGLATNEVTTVQTTATPAGGFAPYTYAWSLVTNDGGTASTASSPSGATTSFSKKNVAVNDVYRDVWRVTVTDSTGDTATDEITVTFSNISTGGF